METSRTLEQMNAAQQKTILELTARVNELKLWEKFAAHLINKCTDQIVTPDNLEKWLEECQK